MKKICLLAIFLCSFCLLSNAQYRINKKTYDRRTYHYEKGDRCSPAVAGIASFFIPGLGQMVCGEPVRGLCFMVPAYTGVTVGMVELIRGMSGMSHSNSNAGNIFLFSFGLYYALELWSTIDAVHVAKVNNMAFRDKQSATYRFKVMPYVGLANYNLNRNIPIGVSLRIIV